MLKSLYKKKTEFIYTPQKKKTIYNLVTDNQKNLMLFNKLKKKKKRKKERLKNRRIKILKIKKQK